MKIKIIAVILVFLSSFFGTTVETLAPDETQVEATSCVHDIAIETVHNIE